MTQPLIQGSQIDGSTLTSVDAATLGGQPVGTGPNDILALNGSSQIPAVNGSLLTNVDAVTLGGLSVGTGANNIVQLNGSAQLPAVDGSLLTGISTGPVQDLKVKTASTTRNTTTTYADDPHLVSGSLAPGRYAIEGFIEWNVAGAFTQGIRMNLDLNSGTIGGGSCSWAYNAAGVSPTPQDVAVADVNSGVGVLISTSVNNHGTSRRTAVHGHVEVLTTAVIAFEWAQETSSGDNTSVSEGSWLKFTKLD